MKESENYKFPAFLALGMIVFMLGFAAYMAFRESKRESYTQDDSDAQIYKIDLKYTEGHLTRNKQYYKTNEKWDSIVWYDGEIVVKPINNKELGIFHFGKLIHRDNIKEGFPNGVEWSVMYYISKESRVRAWNLN